jgi:hypothetical protein
LRIHTAIRGGEMAGFMTLDVACRRGVPASLSKEGEGLFAAAPLIPR